MICIYLGIALVLAYTITMCCKIKAIPPSISETYYLGGGIYFTLIMFISSILVTIGLLNLSEGSPWQFISFFTGAGMAFVGAAPLFHDDFEGKVHYGGAFTLLLGSQIWLCLFSTPWMLLCWCLAPLWIKGDSKMFWLEITCIVSVAIGLLFI